ncbi:hypothetical protein ACGFXC_36350 [Streptomyces sp. NPDC048507]|uniref:hypothetical protein n=1 Tax=Streptomyces sp. NPDC048507 TaxID=3365560 RepID=UPI00371E8F1E
MRFRNAAVPALGALALLVAVPNVAQAADGEFKYRTTLVVPHTIVDPSSGVCINLGEATELLAARAPQNLTNATATIFPSFDCDGDDYIVMLPGKTLGERVKLRSVLFSS